MESSRLAFASRRRIGAIALAALAGALSISCGGGDGPTSPPGGGDGDGETTIVVSPAAPSKVAGGTQQFTATVDGKAPTAGQVTWSSSDTEVATIDAASGLATAVAPGTAKIRATVGTAFDEADFTVEANTAPTADAGADLDVNRGATVTLAGSGTDEHGQPLTYRWTQTGGPDVTGGAGFLEGAAPSFTAPDDVTVLRFALVASDPELPSEADEVAVYVLEDATKALWVRPDGDDAAAGTRAAPLKTLGAALAAAEASGVDLYVAEGSYGEQVVLRTGVSLYGGFAADWSARYAADDDAHRSVVFAESAAMVGTGVMDLTVDGFALTGQQPTAPGASTYGIRLTDAARVSISRNAITAGPGRMGASGASGARGADGANGFNAVREGLGSGAFGGSPNGARGGDGGTETVAARPGGTGIAGSGPRGGAGGSPGQAAVSDAGGGAGGRGGDGLPGVDGAAGAPLGTFGAGGYVPAWGGNGTDGGNGGGGGGGGGGRNVYFFPANYHGGGGGGGGGGGAGGTGATGGQGGGGSFGVLLVNSTEIELTGNTITLGAGGQGGLGGYIGAGGAGGKGGFGFDPSTANDGRHGGRGGDGGHGGRGGRGGGGAGGPAIGIVAKGGSFTNTANTVTGGVGGAGGEPNGPTGQAATQLVIP